jgi:hypothetical protein
VSVFWVVVSCSLVEVYNRFKDPCCPHHQGDDDGGGKPLWNAFKLLLNYTAQKPRRQTSKRCSCTVLHLSHLQTNKQPWNACIQLTNSSWVTKKNIAVYTKCIILYLNKP